jgi:hypothetical protein
MAVRHPLFRGARSARALLIAAATISLAACSGSSGTGNGPVPQTNGPCLPSDTQATLAVPNNANGQFVNPASITKLELVTNGNSNSFASSFAQYMLVAVGAGTNVVSQNLSLVADPGAPHPYPSDYYYAGTVSSSQFFSGVTYTVYLNTQASNCTPTPIGQFQT